MKTEERIVPLAAFNAACQRFVDEQLDDPLAYLQSLYALTMVHTVIEFEAICQECHQRKSAWFPRRSRRRERPLCMRFPGNVDGLVTFKDRIDLPLPLVWRAAIALYGLEAVSPLEKDGFTILLPVGMHP